MTTFLIEAVAQYRMVYCVEAPTAELAQQCVAQGKVPEELGQKHLGEVVVQVRAATPEQILEVHDELNPWRDTWSVEQKLSVIHVCDQDP